MRHLLLLIFFLLIGCSQPEPVHTPEKRIQLQQTPQQPTDSPEAALKAEAQAALKQHQLIKATTLLTQLWATAPAETQLLIEYTLYEAWHHADLNALQPTTDPVIQPWWILSELEQAQDPAALEKTLGLYPEALFAHHLAPYLKNPPAPTLKKIAVFLPLSGRFAQIGIAVRNGMLKKVLQQHQQIELIFYDSAQTDTLQQNYQDALTRPVDAIIGPIQKKAIAELSQISQLPTLFLNEKPTDFGHAFSFATPSEAAQIAAKLHQLNIQRVGIFYKPKGRSAQLQATLEDLWQGEQLGAVSQYYSGEPRDIRRAFDQLLNIDKSKQRGVNLHYLLQRPVAFEPRPRQDLQALVLLTNQQEAAIVNPMLKFYGIKLPLLGSTLMMPITFSHHKHLQRDLAGVVFPAFPALYSHSALHTPLQAWGWDALTALETLPLPPATCLKGQTGWLQAQDGHIDRALIWLKYTPSGKLTLWSTP